MPLIIRNMNRKHILALAVFVAVAAMVYYLVDSRGLLVFFTAGIIAALDLTLFGLLCGSLSEHEARSRLARYAAMSFVVGLIVFLFGRGAIPVGEAAFVGGAFGLLIALVELLQILVARVVARFWKRHDAAKSPTPRIAGMCLAYSGVLFLLPVVGALHLVHSVPPVNPAHLGIGYEDIEMETADGMRLQGWYVPVENPRGTVVYCHGHSSNRAQVIGILPTLVDLDLAVLAFDFRGHGGSPGHTVTFGQREVEDLIAAQRLAKQRLPDRPIYVVGVSYGAAVALQSLPKLSEVEAAWLETPFARFVHVGDKKFSYLPEVVREPLLGTYYFLAWLDCGFWPQSVNPAEQLSGCEIPIAFVHGRQDQLIPFSESELLFQQYTGPKQKLWVEGAGHFDLQYVAGDEHRRKLREFLGDPGVLATPVN